MPQFQVFDGFSSLQGGMNGGVLSTQINENQYSLGVNVTCRDGVLSTRPPFIEIALSSDIEGAIDNIQTGKFQGMTYYQHGNNAYIVFAFNGYVYLLDPVGSTIWDMTAVPGAFDQTVDRLHYCQVEEYLVVQDGINVPLIIDDTASRKAVQGAPDFEVPTGTVMAYCQGRLFIKTTDRGFVAGNINMPNTPGNVLIFTETEYLAGGGAFFVPADMGNIISMTWSQSYGEATGEGPLIVMCERGIASYMVSVPRLQWQDMPIMKIEPAGNGCASEFCTVRMNEDLLFMSWIGIQDFKLLNVESASHHRMTNLNTEVKPFVDLETRSLLPFTHATKFDDRFLYTSIGETVTALNLSGVEVDDYRFQGLVALDFAPTNGIASMGQTLRPSYDGIWTGVHPAGVSSGIFDFEERCYVVGKDNSGRNHLYELMKDQGYDKGNIPIECRLYMRGMPFIAYDKEYPRPVPQHFKTLIDGSLWIVSFRDDISFVLSVCPDHTVHFHELSTIRVNAPMVETVSPFTAGSMQSRPKQPFPAFKKNECEQVSGRNVTVGFEFQFLLTWAGIANIAKFMISADAHREVKNFECGLNETVLTDAPPDDFTYDIEA